MGGRLGGLRLCSVCSLWTQIVVDTVEIGEFRIAYACDGVCVRFGGILVSAKRVLGCWEGRMEGGEIVKGETEGRLEFGVG